MFLLHDIVFPAEREKTPLLYLRATGGADLGRSGMLRLRKGEGFSTDTYFGAFPLSQWMRLADLDHLALVIRGTGDIGWAVKQLETSAGDRVLASGTAALAEDVVIDLSAALYLAETSALYLELVAEADTVLASASFWTESRPVRRVNLGLIITTFGRAPLVRKAVGELESWIARDREQVLGSLSLTVVDNGREFPPDSFRSATVLPNPNLGGAGGFARGLSHLTDEGTATHACFMDDDAATEEECLLRIRRMLAYARDERTAISGAMLRAEMDFMMHEQGAIIEWARGHRIISRKNGLDLRHRACVQKALHPETVGYGGWWLFAFPIRPDLRYPYPLFVRGDDWLFSYLNDFSIEVSVGICSWQEGFENKIGPIEQYLAMKAFLIAEIMLRRPPRTSMTVLFFGRWILRNLLGFCYDRAAMNCEALEDTLNGPAFWARNVALSARLGDLRSRIVAEKLQPISPPMASLPLRQNRHEGFIRKSLRLVTLNGHLVPSPLTRIVQPCIAVARVEAPQPVLAFLRHSVIYRDPERLDAFVAVRDTPRLLGILFRATKLLVRLAVGLRALQAAYRTSIDWYCTKAWWDSAIEEESRREAEARRTV